jgi:hypothetical protein
MAGTLASRLPGAWPAAQDSEDGESAEEGGGGFVGRREKRKVHRRWAGLRADHRGAVGAGWCGGGGGQNRGSVWGERQEETRGGRKGADGGIGGGAAGEGSKRRGQ